MKIKILILMILVLTCIIITNVGLAIAQETPPPTPTPPTPEQTTTANSATSSGTVSLGDSTILSVSFANLDPNPPIAGEIVEVRIGIENIGGETVNDLMIEIMPEYPFDLVPGETAVKSVGIVEGYEADSTANIKIVKYRLKINKDASAGGYELKIKYYKRGSVDSVVKNLFIDVKSRNNVEVIHIDKTTLIPGDQNSLRFRINNVGNAPLRDVTFSWENKNGAILPVGGDNTKNIKYIDINEGFDLEYQVIADTNINPGLYKLDLYLTYTDNINGTKKQLVTMAGVYIGGETDFDVSFSEITSGDTSFSVSNVGSNPAYAVLVSIPKQEDWKVRGSNSVTIGNLDSGDYTSASFKLLYDGLTYNRDSYNLSDIVVQVAYTDTMGKRKIVGKKVELAPRDIMAIDENVKQEKQEGTNYVTYIILLAMIIFSASTYRRYEREKLLDKDLKIWDVLPWHVKKKIHKE